MSMQYTIDKYFLALARITLGWIFFWAFLDKVFGLGFTTESGKTWLDGVSPTYGFLKFASKGIFAPIHQAIAGNPVVDWLFMLGLLGIGIALILGIGMKIASYSGAFLSLLLWSAVVPPEHNPIVDEHIVYLFVFLALSAMHAGDYLGLGVRWSQTALVRKYPWLR